MKRRRPVQQILRPKLLGFDLGKKLVNHYVWSCFELNGAQVAGTKLFQIVGVPRSGTTLLACVMNSVPGVTCLSEPYGSWLWQGHVSFGNCTWYKHPSRLIKHLCKQSPGTYVGFKEVFYSHHHDAAHRNEQFFLRNKRKGITTIAIVRDPRDIYTSVEDRLIKGGSLKEGRENVPSRFVYSWLRMVEFAIDHADILVRYEDLVVEPERELGRICQTLEMPCEYQNVALDGQAGYGDEEALGGGEIHRSSLNKYRGHLSRNKIEYIENICSQRMVELRYLND